MVFENKEINQIKAALKPEFNKIDSRFKKIDKKFEQIDKRFEQVDARFDSFDLKFKDLREFISRCFQNFELMLNSYTTKEEFNDLKGRVENVEDSNDEIRKSFGMVVRDASSVTKKK